MDVLRARHARDHGHRIEAGKAATIPPAGQTRHANERDSSAPGAAALTGAELRLLPLLSTHLSLPEIAGGILLVPAHHQVAGGVDLPEAGGLLPQPGGRPIPRAWTPGG
jgi:hypothetical protein